MKKKKSPIQEMIAERLYAIKDAHKNANGNQMEFIEILEKYMEKWKIFK